MTSKRQAYGGENNWLMSAGLLPQSFAAPILSVLSQVGLAAKLHSEAPDTWRDVSSNIGYLPVAYSKAMIDYQIAYFQGAGQPVVDISMILFHDNRPCGIWPLSLIAAKENPLGSNGGALLPPLFESNLARKSAKAITRKCLDFADVCVSEFGGNYWRSAESFFNRKGISEWHDQALRRGGTVELRHDLFVDLSLSLAEIKAGFRKSYKSLISSGSKLWKVAVLDYEDVAVWDEFRTLHFMVAGRATRSEESWTLQHQAVAKGHAFLVYLRDDAGRMVGGGLFHLTPHEGLYAVAAYDRNLFDKPLGHVVQYLAIEEMKRRGVLWYSIGLRPYPSDVPPASAKEIAIVDFKQGFASHIFPSYLIRHGVDQSG